MPQPFIQKTCEDNWLFGTTTTQAQIQANLYQSPPRLTKTYIYQEVRRTTTLSQRSNAASEYRDEPEPVPRSPAVVIHLVKKTLITATNGCVVGTENRFGGDIHLAY